MKDSNKIIASTLLSNIIGALVVFSYFAYADIATFLSNKAFWRGTDADWVTFWVTVIGVALIGWGVAQRYLSQLTDWESKIQAGAQPGDMPLKLRRRAASLPLYMALVNWGLWLLDGLFFGLGARNFGMTDFSIFLRTFLGVGIIGGLTISTLIFLLVDRIWSGHLPVFFPKDDIGEVGAPRVTVGMRVVATFLLTGLVPLLSLGAAAQNSAVNIMDTAFDPYEVLERLRLTIYFLVGASIAANLLITTLTSGSLLRPLHALTEAMRKISDRGDLDTRVPLSSNDELGDLTASFNTMLGELQQGQRMRDLFGKYVSKEVATQVLMDGGNLGGTSSQATALFTDIRDFTTLAETLPPEQIADILNRYYTRMVDVVVAEGGIVNKFGGDSLLAIFGVPIRQPDHALRAVRAAWQMNCALAEFNAEQIARQLPTLTIGVGISTGEVFAGNVGGQDRLEYTIIGDPVNLAARLQTLTKELHASVLLSEDTAAGARPTASLTSRGPITVKGKTHPVEVFELSGLAGAESRPPA